MGFALAALLLIVKRNSCSKNHLTNIRRGDFFSRLSFLISEYRQKKFHTSKQEVDDLTDLFAYVRKLRVLISKYKNIKTCEDF